VRIRQKDFDGLTQQLWLSCRFDGLQTGLSHSPAITPPSHCFIIYVLVLGYLRIARSRACCQDDVSSLDQSLRARCASYHALKDVELQGTRMDWGSLRLWHSILLLRIAFPLILSYPPLLRYFREAVLVRWRVRGCVPLHAALGVGRPVLVL